MVDPVDGITNSLQAIPAEFKYPSLVVQWLSFKDKGQLGLLCNPLQGKYRFFTGNSLCSISTLTCFGSVQGLKGTNFIEIQGNICILYRNIALDIYIHVYVLITGISLLFEKQQHRILEKQEKPCK